MDLSAQIQAYLREQMRLQREAVFTSGFTIFFNPNAPEDSWAIPDEHEGDISPDAIAALCAAFHEHNHTPHIQWLASFAPDLRMQLSEHGFEQISDYPVLVCTTDALIEPAPIDGFSVDKYSSASSLEEIKAAWDANAAGFEEEVRATDKITQEFRASLITARAFIAYFDRQPAASGMFNAIRDGITELVGISTMPHFRRRGFAANLTAAMTKAAFADGVEVPFLTAVSDEAARVYARVGYTATDHLLKYKQV